MVLYYSFIQRNSTLELEQGYKDSTIGLNQNPVSWLVEIIELKKV